MAVIKEEDRVDFADALTPQVLEAGGVGEVLKGRGLLDHVTPEKFGAIGGTPNQSFSTLPDDTIALQASIDECKATGKRLLLGARAYRFTAPLDCTKPAANNYPLMIEGFGKLQSVLVADLPVDGGNLYPAIDVTNQKRGNISNLAVRNTTTSQHGCLILLGETAATAMNNFSFYNVFFSDSGSVSKCASYGLCVDEIVTDLAEFIHSGPNGMAAFIVDDGSINPGIASKYRTPGIFGGDLTANRGSNSRFICTTGPAFWARGYTKVAQLNSYFAITGGGGHTLGVLRVGSGSLGRFARLILDGVRMEDNATVATSAIVTGGITPNSDGLTSTLAVSATNSGALAVGSVLTNGAAGGTTILASLGGGSWTTTRSQTVAGGTNLTASGISSPGIYIEDEIFNSFVNGSINLRGAGVFGGPGKQHGSTVKLSKNYIGFNNSGALIGGTFIFDGGVEDAGPFDQINSRNYALGGMIAPSFVSAVARYSSAGEILFSSGVADASNLQAIGYVSTRKRALFPRKDTPLNWRYRPYGPSADLGRASYTGANLNTNRQLSSVSIPTSPLSWSGDTASVGYPWLEARFEGDFASTWAAGGTIIVTLVQSPGNATLATLTGIGAQSTGDAIGYEVVVRFYRNSGTANDVSAYATIKIWGAAPKSIFKYTGLLSATGFDLETAGANNMTLGFTINNSGADPVTHVHGIVGG